MTPTAQSTCSCSSPTSATAPFALAQPTGLSPPALQILHHVEQRRARGLLADGLTDFDDLLERYVRERPCIAGEKGRSDVAAFLDWLLEQPELDAGRRESVIQLQSRCTVELIALRQRLAHARFQMSLSGSETMRPRLARCPGVRLHLNPVSVWATVGAQGTDDVEPSTSRLLFFVVGDEVRQAALDKEAEWVVRQLERGAQPLSALLCSLPKAHRAAVLETIDRLLALQVLAMSAA